LQKSSNYYSTADNERLFMEQISGAPFVAAIVIIGIGTMLRLIKLPAAILLIAIVLGTLAFLPLAGNYAKYVPTWLFWIIAVVLAINLLRGVLGILFGRSAADGMTGSLLHDLFSPIFRIIGGLLRTVFRIR
jgi:hypothetical protein